MIAVFDGHNDALTKPDHDRFVSGRDGGHLDIPRMRAGGMRGGIFAIFTPSPTVAGGSVGRRRHASAGPSPGSRAPLAHPDAAAHASAAAGRLLALERAGALRVGRAIADIDAAASDSGAPVAVLHLEGAEAIDPALEALDLWHAAGLRSLGPVWSRPNAFAHGVPFGSPGSPDVGPGLTEAGVRLVRRCAELGILIDLSHMNEAGFWDVARLQAGPLVASHSGVHRLCPAPRNLTDAQLDEIGATGGLVGIVFGPAFLRADFADDPDTSLALSVEHVALGSDFDGITMPAALADASGLPLLLDEFARAGFTSEDLHRLAWGNWRRVLARWWAQ